jgi:hypothetical protein
LLDQFHARVERIEVNDQVADHREIAQRFNLQYAAIRDYVSDEGNAGQFFHTIHAHPTCAAGGVMTGVTKAQGTIMECPDTFYGIQDVFVRIHLHAKLIKMGFLLAFLAINL